MDSTLGEYDSSTTATREVSRTFAESSVNREDIIRMAGEAQMPFYWRTGEITYLDKLERFASLVASAEREACEKLAENTKAPFTAIAIRARGQA